MSELDFRTFWFEGKRLVEDFIGLEGSEAHVHLGLTIFLISAVLFRHRKFGLIAAWSVVFFLELINEVLDARDWINWTGEVNWSETLRDFTATLFWPTMLCIVMWLFLRRAPVGEKQL